MIKGISILFLFMIVVNGCAYKTCKARNCQSQCSIMYDFCNINKNPNCSSCKDAHSECIKVCDNIERNTNKKNDWRCE